MSGRRDSNPRPLAWKANALSTELLPHNYLSKNAVQNYKISSKTSNKNYFSCLKRIENKLKFLYLSNVTKKASKSLVLKANFFNSVVSGTPLKRVCKCKNIILKN
jgi:hypothetical protein